MKRLFINFFLMFLTLFSLAATPVAMETVPMPTQTFIQTTSNQTHRITPTKTGGFIQVLFWDKFQKFLVGEAYEMLTTKDNAHLLEKVSWKSAPYDFEYRNDMVTRSHNEKNTQALEEFRNYLERHQDNVPGLVGLLNRYSQQRAYLAQRKDVLPQSDVCYIGPKETFVLYNNNSQARPVAEIFIENFGEFDNSELRVLRNWIAMDAVIPAYENYYYEDYAVECNLGQNGSRQQSWLSLFFYRKNSVNPNSWNVTPVSYAPLSRELITQSKLSAHLFQSLEAFAYEQKIRFEDSPNLDITETIKTALANRRQVNGLKNKVSFAD